MSLDSTHWRSPSEYEYVATLSAPDLAWEWLRRNADYQSDYAGMERTKEHSHRLTQIVRQSWGLRFPGRSPAGRLDRSGVLATGGRSGNGHSDIARIHIGTAAYFPSGIGAGSHAPRFAECELAARS